MKKLIGKLKQITNTPNRRQKLIRRLIQGLVLFAIFCMAIGNISPENDIYWQLKIGESIWKYHIFPTRDPYNFTNPNAVWTLEEWTVEVLFYLLQTYFGWWVLILLKAVIVTTAFAILLHILNKMKINLYLSLAALFLAAMVNTRGYWSVFPSLFEYLFVVVAFYCMELYRQGKFRLWPFVIPFFSLLWANSHASFFLLEGITISYIVGSIIGRYLQKRFPGFSPWDGLFSLKQIRDAGLATFVAFLMPFFSPNFYNTWLYPFIISGAKFSTTYVNEYISFPNYVSFFQSSYLVSFSIILFVGVVLLMLFSINKVNPIDVILLMLFSYLAFRAFRHLAIFSLIALPLFVRYASIWFREYRGWLARSLIKDVLMIVLILSFLFWYKTKQVPFGLGIDMSGFPVDAANFVLRNHIEPNMFNHYNYGGFLIWKMPGYKVFIDGRLEMYLGQAGDDYLTVLEARPGWEKVLDKYHVNFFLNYATTPITKVLLGRKDWKLLYFDSQYVVFVKDTRQNYDVISRYYDPSIADEYKKSFMATIAKNSAEEFNQDGLKQVQAGNLQAAVLDFEKAVFLDSHNLIAVENLAQAYVDTRAFDKAYYAYKLALLIDPTNQLASKRYTELKTMLGLK